jgi:hypothetical protein
MSSRIINQRSASTAFGDHHIFKLRHQPPEFWRRLEPLKGRLSFSGVFLVPIDL